MANHVNLTEDDADSSVSRRCNESMSVVDRSNYI